MWGGQHHQAHNEVAANITKTSTPDVKGKEGKCSSRRLNRNRKRGHGREQWTSREHSIET